MYSPLAQRIYLHQAAYKIGNASITWTPALAKWSLRCFVNNVTDVRYVVSGDSNYGIGFHEAEYNRSREWGVAGKISFLPADNQHGSRSL